MKGFPIFVVFAIFALCQLFYTTPTPATETPALIIVPIETETFAPVCTPPACQINETYSCPGDCPGGCGTVCATVTPDSALLPLATVDGAGTWIMRTEQNLVYMDPSGLEPNFNFQRLYVPLVDFVLTREGNVYTLTDEGDSSLVLKREYPREFWLGKMDTRRNFEGSPRIAPIFSSNGSSLVWSRSEEDGGFTRAVFVTSLDTGESHEVWRTELSMEAGSHAIVPLFLNETQGTLVYALHTFYSGMAPNQVASLYIADITTDKITPLWALNPSEMYAGVSAAISPDGGLLAYLTWGEPQDDFSLPWTLHLRDLSNGKETTHPLTETWNNAEVHLFAPDGNKLLFTVSRYDANNEYQTEMLVFDLKSEGWTSIYTPDYNAKPYFTPHVWSNGDWLIFTSDNDYSTWVMQPDGGSLTQVTALEWVGMMQP